MNGTGSKGATAQTGERKRPLLIVVDAEGAHLYYTSMLLQRLEYFIHATKSAKDALEVMDVSEPALVLSETSLADMDGTELLRKIKQSPRTYSIPVIMLTASKDPLVKAACLKDGCTAFLQKPVEPDVLYAAIQKATESTPRRYIRLATSLNVIVGDDKAAEFAGSGDYITALSENGMYVSTAKPKPRGTELPLTIFLRDARIKVVGTVLYSFERGKGPLKTPGMGIQFLHIHPDDQNLIKHFIKGELTQDLTMGQIGGTVF